MIAGFRLILASSVGDRDGMALELTRDDGERLAEVFADEETGQRIFNTFGERGVPVEAIEWLLAEAKERL